MHPVDAWPHLREFCKLSAAQARVQVWLFGSALTLCAPSDLDVLLVYDDRVDVVAIRSARRWPDFEPPIRIIAMSPSEERHYRFIDVTRAQRLV